MSEDRKLLLILCIIGFLLGMVLCNAITIMFSSTPDQIVIVAPELSARFGEPLAIVLQTLIGGLIGLIAFSATAVFYDDRFSLVAATLIHMAVSVSALVIGGYFLEWVGHTLGELLLFMILPMSMYVLIWFSVYISYRVQIKQINESLERRRSGKDRYRPFILSEQPSVAVRDPIFFSRLADCSAILEEVLFMDMRKMIPVIAMIGVLVMFIWGYLEGTFAHSWLAVMAAGIVIVAVSIIGKGKQGS